MASKREKLNVYQNLKFKIFKLFFIGLSVTSAVLLSVIGYLNFTLPTTYNTVKNQSLEIGSNLPVEAVFVGYEESLTNTVKASQKGYSVNLKAFGLFPIKKASVSVINDTDILLGGTPFGIKIYTNGVIVVGIDSVSTQSGKVTPAKSAGLEKGDVIISINGENVYSNEDVANLVEKSNGCDIKMLIKKGEKTKNITIKPALCYQSGKYKTGIWVRDSSAGIGTLTFYSPSQNIMCGLGHGICDVDTGELLPLYSGELVKAEILSVEKGSAGSPGELIGKFEGTCLGELLVNNETGVYAKCNAQYKTENLIKMALKQEVKVGKAKIYTTVDGQQPQFYDCEIENISHNNSVTKNMVIKITDKTLLSKTGGIVQGMSGSPIIQNGKLVGAVTHVFLDDPTSGYAIFAENMLKTAQTANKENLKEAS